MKKASVLSILLGALMCTRAFAADIDVSGRIETNTTWTKNNTYFISGYVFVITPAGAPAPVTLTIEPGTVIKARQGAGAGASALVITRGARIHAAGTVAEPIIFTSELDNLQGNLTHLDTSLWGGVVLLGRATVSSRADNQVVAPPVTDQIEGFEVTAADIPLITFGGTDDEDNSGVMRYVSIRHGGAVIGTANEINGLTLGGVGRGTTIEYIEVFANKDDGFEWFGGTVDAKYLVSAFNNDDSFDYDQGWRGRGQFWLSVQTDITTDVGDKAGELDGATAPLNALPIGGGTIANWTAIGVGNALQPGGAAGRANTALNIRDNAIARIYNSVFVDFNKMLSIEGDNQERVQAGDVDLRSNVFFSHIAANNTPAGLDDPITVGGVTVSGQFYFTETARNNVIANPQLVGIGRDTNGVLDPRPSAGSPALTTPVFTLPQDGFFTQANYLGAFSAQNNWLAGWTKLSQDGYLAPSVVEGSTSKLENLSNFLNLPAQGEISLGFVVGGTEPQSVLVRAVGPSLAEVGLPAAGLLPDPVLEVFRRDSGAGLDQNVLIATNDDYAAGLTPIFGRAGAFELAPDGKDAAILLTATPGVYTVVVRDKNRAGGQLLVEIYEVD